MKKIYVTEEMKYLAEKIEEGLEELHEANKEIDPKAKVEAWNKVEQFERRLGEAVYIAILLEDALEA